MSNPTELPDLRNVIQNAYIGYTGEHLDAGIAEAIANEVAAHRAQPEGEAPQAEHSRFGSPEMQARILSNLAPSSLPPLCGAQHAESGKEAAVFANDGAEPDWSSYAAAEAAPCPYCGSKDGQHDRAYPHPRAAQQAAAPGTKLMTYDEFFAEARRLGCKLPADVCTALAAAPDYSAPGTPEAPKQPAHGHRDDYYLLANGRRLGLEPISRVRNMPNWVLAMELFATGSTSAHQLCRDAGVDPDSATTQRAAAPKGGA